MLKQKLHKLISVFLLLIFAFPQIVQPAHYLVIHHDNALHSHSFQLDARHAHTFCAIDNLQLTETDTPGLNEFTQKLYFRIIAKQITRFVFIKITFAHHFLLRAPPL
jgi:hypothetical protein